MKRSPIRNNVIRQLRPGEAVPADEPRRYRSGHGYIRLRWLVGPRQYVETYEHRVVDGYVTTAEHVHHKNHVKHDNRPGNLAHLTAADHALAHSDELEPLRDRAVTLYQTGHSTTEVGRILGVNHGTVSRWIGRKGKKARTRARYVSPLDMRTILRRYQSGEGYASLARSAGVSTGRMRSLISQAGIELRGVGRVPESAIRITETDGRRLVVERSGGMCELVCRSAAREWHHRKNRSQGGDWSASNGLHLCSEHHRYITENPDEACDKGWSVRSYADPRNTPVQESRYGWVLLSDDGGIVEVAHDGVS